MKKKLVIVPAVLVFVFLVIQLVPVDRTNPPEAAAFTAPAEVMAVVNSSCADCHSNRTRWPWYSRVAPASWLVAHDVKEAREHLNLSSWGQFPADKQARMRGEMLEHVEKSEMPPGIYLIAHHDASLDDQDREILRRWATTAEPEAAPEADSVPAATAESEAQE